MGIWDRLSRRLDELSEEFLPDDVRDTVEGARGLLEKGEPGAAAAALEQALKAKPNHATALYLLGVAQLRRGDAGAAAVAFRKAVDARAGFGEALIGLGEAHLALGDAPAAVPLFREALSLGGSSETLADAYRGLGRAYLATGLRDKGLRELRKALAEEPDDEAAASALADALLADPAADPAEARTALARVKSPGPATLVSLGRLELAAGRAEAGGQLLDKALAGKLAPAAQVNALAGLADAALARGDSRGAHERLLQALALAPGRADLHLRLGRVHRATRSPEAALDAFDRALALGADVLGEALETALAADLPARAGAYADKILAVRPDAARALAARGAALAAAGDPGARALLERAPDEPVALMALARLAIADGAPERAAEAARAALRRAPENEAARALLAEAVTRGLGGVAPAGDLYALASRIHGATLARAELADLAGDAGRAVASYDAPLLVTVMGEFSSGKSTFVNAFLGAEVAPVGITPTTATINILQYGRTRGARVVYLDDRVRELTWDEVPRVLRAVDDEEARRIRIVEVLYPAEALSQVNIVDTPGLNSILPEHEATARQFIAQADAVIWLFTAMQAGKASEREALTKIRAEGKRILGVVNKIDQASPDEVARIVAHLEAELGGLVEAFVPVSAKRAVEARRGGDEDALAASLWPGLSAALEERFFHQARALKRAACAQRLGQILARGQERLRSQGAAAADRVDAAEKAATAARADAVLFARQVVPEERRRLAERAAGVYRAAAREVLELVRPRKTPFGSHRAAIADRDFLVGFLDRGLTAALEPTRQRVAAELAPTGAAGLVEARVFDRTRAFVHGYLRGGHVDEFFTRALPKLELSEDAVYHALARDAPDLDAEVAEPLLAQGDAALRAHADRLRAQAALADVERLEADTVLAALEAYEAERVRLR